MDPREQFGARAEEYLSSRVHARGRTLERAVEILAPRGDDRTLGVGTGAGHLAFALAGRVREVSPST